LRGVRFHGNFAGYGVPLANCEGKTNYFPMDIVNTKRGVDSVPFIL
jgi:hypothetical protein